MPAEIEQMPAPRMLVMMPITCREDIPAAIAAAANNPAARWYVEKRVTALRATDEFPLPWRKP